MLNLFLASLAAIFGPAPVTQAHYAPGAVHEKTMVSSFYGAGERLNAHTANGERFRPGGMTAAHRTLPFGTRLRVCYVRCAIVRVNDRGPHLDTGRNLDLAHGAAVAVGLQHAGVGRVRVAIVSP